MNTTNPNIIVIPIYFLEREGQDVYNTQFHHGHDGWDQSNIKALLESPEELLAFIKNLQPKFVYRNGASGYKRCTCRGYNIKHATADYAEWGDKRKFFNDRFERETGV